MAARATLAATSREPRMTGAELVLRRLAANGVDVCFTNPGTSETAFVQAAESVREVRTARVLFEGAASGAADGSARVAKQPAATLLHFGPGFANAMANLHNARRARFPLVRLVGDHAVSHLGLDAPLVGPALDRGGVLGVVEVVCSALHRSMRQAWRTACSTSSKRSARKPALRSSRTATSTASASRARSTRPGRSGKQPRAP
jgi:thiamine pyrophosphate-dependent acetolactate synthase large subunit-like protein